MVTSTRSPSNIEDFEEDKEATSSLSLSVVLTIDGFFSRFGDNGAFPGPGWCGGCGVGNGSFWCVCHRKNEEHTARPKTNAVIRSIASLIVDTDIGVCDLVDDRDGIRVAAAMVVVFVRR